MTQMYVYKIFKFMTSTWGTSGIDMKKYGFYKYKIDHSDTETNMPMNITKIPKSITLNIVWQILNVKWAWI